MSVCVKVGCFQPEDSAMSRLPWQRAGPPEPLPIHDGLQNHQRDIGETDTQREKERDAASERQIQSQIQRKTDPERDRSGKRDRYAEQFG